MAIQHFNYSPWTLPSRKLHVFVFKWPNLPNCLSDAYNARCLAQERWDGKSAVLRRDETDSPKGLEYGKNDNYFPLSVVMIQVKS